MNQVLDKIKGIVARELDNFPDDSQQMSYECFELMDKLIDIWKDACEIEEKESMMSSYDDGYSRDGYSQRGYGNGRMMPRYYDGNSYNGSGGASGNSYGGSRGSSYGGSRSGYSRDDAKHDMINKLENLMGEVHDDRDREAIRRMLDGMR